MKKLYWQPSGASRVKLLLIALVAIVGVVALETLPRIKRQPYYASKIAAARLAATCMATIRDEKLKRGITIDPEVDPAGTGMLGYGVTPVTSNTGHLPAKLSTTNPNFAAVVVHMLRQVKVREGSVVAVGVSGSFPAMNVAVYSALQTMKTDPIIVASAASSAWGATDVNYLWLDMERTLFERHLIGFRSRAASRGGIDDRGFGISRKGRALLDEAIERAEVVRLEPQSLPEAIDLHMSVYYEHAGDRPIAAYINVGGGAASVGTAVGKRLFDPGVNRVAPKGATDSVMSRFVKEGVPVLHMSGINEIANQYGLPLAPTTLQRPGDGGIYAKVGYNPWFAIFGIVTTLGTMVVLLRLDVDQLFHRRRKHKAPSVPPAAIQDEKPASRDATDDVSRGA